MKAFSVFIFLLGHVFLSNGQQSVGNLVYLDEFSEPLFYCEIDSASCAEVANGAITLSGVNEHITSFVWSNGSTDSTLMNLAVGEYGLTVFTEFGTSYFLTFMIYGPKELTLSIDKIPMKQQFLLRAVASGGTSPYHYQWSSGQDTESITLKQAGLYSCEIKDAKGCLVTNSLWLSHQEDIENHSDFSISSTGFLLPSIDLKTDITFKQLVKVDGGLVKSNFVDQTSIELSNLSSGMYVLIYQKNDELAEKLLLIP